MVLGEEVLELDGRAACEEAVGLGGRDEPRGDAAALLGPGGADEPPLAEGSTSLVGGGDADAAAQRAALKGEQQLPRRAPVGAEFFLNRDVAGGRAPAAPVVVSQSRNDHN